MIKNTHMDIIFLKYAYSLTFVPAIVELPEKLVLRLRALPLEVSRRPYLRKIISICVIFYHLTVMPCLYQFIETYRLVYY